MKRLRAGQRVIPGLGVIRGGAATRRTGQRPPAPEHQLAPDQVPAPPPLDYWASKEEIRKLHQTMGWPAPDDPAWASGPAERTPPERTEADIEARRAELLAQAAQLAGLIPCAKCHAPVAPTALVPVGLERWCLACRARWDQWQIEHPQRDERSGT